MAKKKVVSDLDSMRKFALGGALTIKSTDLISHARNPTALTGDIGGFVGIGVAGATSDIAMGMITGKHKKKTNTKKCWICNKYKPMKEWSICTKCKHEYGRRKWR